MTHSERKDWDDLVLHADNVLASAIDIGETNPTVLEVFHHDLRSILAANAELLQMREELRLVWDALYDEDNDGCCMVKSARDCLTHRRLRDIPDPPEEELP